MKNIIYMENNKDEVEVMKHIRSSTLVSVNELNITDKKEIINKNHNLPNKNNAKNNNNKIEDKDKDKDKNKNKNTQKLKILFLVNYFLVIISVEFLYRNNLHNISMNIQEDIKGNKEKKHPFYIFLKIITKFGEEIIMIPIFVVIFLFFPINISFFVLLIIIYSSYITGLFKMIYKEKRPYWYSDILDIVCNKGYGNPSGHSLSSTTLYLSLSHIINNYFSCLKNRKILKIIIFIIFSILILLIMISRFILSAHSLNQILYGFSLGIGLYFLFIHILGYNTYQSSEFLPFIQKTKVLIIYSTINILLLFASILSYFLIKEDENLKNYVKQNVFNGIRCKYLKEYNSFKNGGFFQSLLILALLGAHLGLKILVILLTKFNYIINEYINEFNYSSIKRWFFRIVIIILSMFSCILYFSISDKCDLVYIFIFKFGLSFFLISFGLYSIGIFFSIYFNCANENISKLCH